MLRHTTRQTPGEFLANEKPLREANTARPPQSPPHRLAEFAMAVVRHGQNFPLAADPLPGGAEPTKI